MSLDQQTAIKRTKLIRQDSLSYNYHIILETELYHGLAELTFYLETLPQSDLLLDYSGDEVQELIVNGLQPEFDDDERENFIVLPRAYLQKGKNRVTVMYHSEFNKDLSGLISFTDHDQQFLYTDFEPYGANRVFPCFDQPDLKAYMNLTVVGPDQWRILSHQDPISNESFRAAKYVKNAEWHHERSKHLLDVFSKKVKDGQNSKLTVFPTTKKLPSYIFCFCAGDYKEVPCDNPDAPVRMSLFCIPDAKAKLQKYSKLIFDTTISCMKLFKDKFGLAFPFNKYDQIFIREFGAYAMENAGIVTFSQENMLPNENATQYDLYIIALVVSHELSHHWFGNYVTMKWWDDLWLNESFAEWMSCYSLEALKNESEFKFQSYFYFRDGKIRGYEDDERKNSNHPIRGTVANTSEAFSIFDGITYEKGASALKQLLFLVTEDQFFAGVKNYFSRFPWGNATIDDFLEDVGAYFPKEAGTIEDWRKTWLQKASLNVFQIEWDQTNSKITLNQTSFDDSEVLRVHKLKIALFNPDGSPSATTLDVLTKSATTVIPYTGGPYSAVLVNHEDWTFAENVIDPVSLEFFMKNIQKVADPFTRIMIWYNFRSMVNISCISIADYIAFIKEKLFTEEQTFILERILENLRFYLSDFIKESLGNTYRSVICQLIYQQLQQTDKAQTECIQILQDNLIAYSKTDQQINALWNWLNKKDDSLIDKDMNLDQKWRAVLKILTLNMDAALKWNVFYQVRDEDTSASRIQDYTTIVNVLLATEQQFEAVYQQFKQSEVSLSVKYLKATGWRNDYHHDWIVDKYQDKYFDDIVQVSQTLSYEEFQFFYTDLRPLHLDLQTQIDRYNAVILQLEDLGDLKEHCRNLRKFIDDISLRIQNTAFNADENLALSQARAINRYSFINPQSVSYIFHLAFVKTTQYYEGLAEISFQLTKVPSVLPVDCLCETIYGIYANSTAVDPITDGEFLFIPESYLKVGINTLSIRYRNKFNNDGIGCMSFIQAIEGLPSRQYVYTNFEPYGAHRFVPCFDQPDFRASAQFNAIVPSGWMAVANQSELYQGDFSIADYKKQVATWNESELDNFLKNRSGYFYKLTPTMPISTYLYCIAVGQYYRVKVPDAIVGQKTIPMSIYCIQSYKPRLERMTPFITEITVLALKLFSSKFDMPYPFNKYDTIFCHEYKPGAMENPGLISFKDTYLYPEEVSLEKMLALAGTIVHECSHNWFGNLVTMKWWDDLWLNESFADFIAHYGLEAIKDQVTTISKYDSGWKLFLVRGVAGYREDQITATTHAVRSVVQNTSVASTYFDRITYQKGSACLKQFMFLMGEDNFFNGLKDYFKAFQWQNTTIDDFLNKMQKYFLITEFTLDDWKNSWLLAPSLNTVQISWDPSDISETATLTINQKYYSDVYPTLRYHKTRVAFFKADCSYIVKDVLLTPTPTTTLTYDGSQEIKAILVNQDYWSYFKYTIDETSLAFFEENLNNINQKPQDVLTRMIIWHDINEQVRDSAYKVQDYVATLRKFIFTEPDDKIFEFQFSFARDAVNNYLPKSPKSDAMKIAIFEDVWDQIQSMRANSADNRLILLKDQLPIFASQPNQIIRLEDWRESFDPHADPDKFAITVSQAWEVVKLFFTLSTETLERKQQIYNDQFGISGGIQGKLVGNTCEALVADDAAMRDIFNAFKRMDWSVDAKESYVAGWNNRVHLDLLVNIFKAEYFQSIPELSKTLASVHFEFFYQNCKPIDDDLEGTIAGYEKIKLQGSEMLGHIKVLTQIKYGYELRKQLHEFNA